MQEKVQLPAPRGPPSEQGQKRCYATNCMFEMVKNALSRLERGRAKKKELENPPEKTPFQKWSDEYRALNSRRKRTIFIGPFLEWCFLRRILELFFLRATSLQTRERIFHHLEHTVCSIASLLTLLRRRPAWRRELHFFLHFSACTLHYPNALGVFLLYFKLKASTQELKAMSRDYPLEKVRN